MPWRGPDEDHAWPTLGYDVGEWIEAHCVVPDGYRLGEPLTLTDEMWTFLIHYYRLHEHAARWPALEALAYFGAQLRRSQKWGKDPFGAAIILTEALGPTRFDGWDASGEPVGAPYPTPLIVCLGTSEDQTDNTYRPILEMIRRGPLVDLPGIDAGETRVVLPSGGKIEPVTTSAKARLGAPLTFLTITEALALDTPLPTPGGWTTMGDVQVGDRLIGLDGQPTMVLKATSVVDDRLCWRVGFADGTSIVADDGHLWHTRISGSAALPKVRATGEMARDGRIFRVPVATAAKLPDIPLPIDPYVLGAWLGDGDARAAMLSSSELDAAEMTRLLRARGYEPRRSSARQRGVLLSIVRADSRRGRWTNASTREKPLKTALREQGLLGNKHIPALYLRASAEQRIDLLHGLMDTDGCVTAAGQCFFAQTDPTLAHDVAELLRSLGQVVSVRWAPDTKSRRGGGYRLNFTPRDGLIPFALPRKVARVRQMASVDAAWVTITSIEAATSVPVRCVAVDSPDHLFLVGDGWHATHNSHLFTLQGGYRRVCGAVKRNVAGMDGRWLELTNAWDPTEGSEAQVTAESDDPRIYVDTVEPRRVDDLDDDEAVYAELLRQYGDSARERGGWVNLRGRIIHEVRSPRHTEADRRRFFLNEIVVGESVFVQPEQWDLQARDNGLRPGDLITLGFDGSKHRDATALIACRMADCHLVQVRIWERPSLADAGWRVPTEEVDQVLRDVFDAYAVTYLYADPWRWQDYLDRWAADLASPEPKKPPKVVEFPTNVEQRMDKAVERFSTAFGRGEITHDGAELLSRHMKNAVTVKGSRKKPRAGEDELIATHYLKLAKRGDGMWIDGAVAAVLAVEARGQAVEDGLLTVPPPPATGRMPVGESDFWRPRHRLTI